MTKKRYRKTPRVSRALRRSRAYPFPRRYAALQGDDEHPVDVEIGRIPRIAKLDRGLVRDSHRWLAEVRDAEAFRYYEDQRLLQRCLREEAFFDAGHELGRVDGVVASLNYGVKLNADAAAFARKVQVARLASRLTTTGAVAVLLELARRLVVGEPHAIRGRR